MGPTQGVVAALNHTAEGVTKPAMPVVKQKRPPLYFDEAGLFYVRLEHTSETSSQLQHHNNADYYNNDEETTTTTITITTFVTLMIRLELCSSSRTDLRSSNSE